MALKLEQKQQIVAEVNEVASSALSAVVADYRGMTVAEMTTMRAKARESGVYVRVVRNTLAKRAVEGTDYACLDEAFIGPTLVAFSQEDPGSAARLASVLRTTRRYTPVSRAFARMVVISATVMPR